MALLSWMTFLPLIGMIVLLFIPDKADKTIKGLTLAVTVLTLILSAVAYAQFMQLEGDAQHIDYAGGMTRDQVVESLEEGVYPFQPPLGGITPWIEQVNINYEIGVDGLSMPLILLTTLLMVLVVIYSWQPITLHVKWYYAFFLLLETSMLGVFISLDLFLFYVFFEIGLVPMYFLIGIWGGPRREYAAIKFFLYTLVGSLAMLLGLLVLYYYSRGTMDTGLGTFSILALAKLQPFTRVAALAAWVPSLVFWGIFLGFAIKTPMWPFHTWLPDAHVEAPTAGSVILAGVLLKLGTYGFVRILMPILPAQCQQYGFVIVVLAVIAIIYGALCAMAQKDLKKLVAYSSVNHMGYVMLGLGAAMMFLNYLGGDADTAALTDRATMAVNGAILQMVAHGLITGALFFLVGMIYDRTHTRQIEDYGGIMRLVPQYGGMLIFMSMASLGLPGLAGFMAEFHIFVGSVGTGLQAVQQGLPDGWMLFTLAALGLIGVVVTAAYFLWMIQRILLGPVNEGIVEKAHGHLTDLTAAEIWTLVPLAILTLLIGIIPGVMVLNLINQFSYRLLTGMGI